MFLLFLPWKPPRRLLRGTLAVTVQVVDFPSLGGECNVSAFSPYSRAIEDKLNALHEERTATLLAGVSVSRPCPGISNCSTAVPLSRSTTAESSSSFDALHSTPPANSYQSSSGSHSFDRSFSPPPRALHVSTLERWEDGCHEHSRRNSPTAGEKGNLLSAEVAFSSSSPVGEHLRESPCLKGHGRGQCAADGDESPGGSVSFSPCASGESSLQDGSAAVLSFPSPADEVLALRSRGQKASAGITPSQACLSAVPKDRQEEPPEKTSVCVGSSVEGDPNVKSTQTSICCNKPTQAFHLQNLADEMNSQQHATPSTVASSLSSSPLASAHGGTSRALAQGTAVSCRKKPPELSQKCVLGEDLHSALRRKLVCTESLSRAEVGFGEGEGGDGVPPPGPFGKVTATSPITGAGLAGHYGLVAGYGGKSSEHTNLPQRVGISSLCLLVLHTSDVGGPRPGAWAMFPPITQASPFADAHSPRGERHTVRGRLHAASSQHGAVRQNESGLFQQTTPPRHATARHRKVFSKLPARACRCQQSLLWSSRLS